MRRTVISESELATAQRLGEICPVYRIDEATVVKSGEFVRMAEAQAMRFVRENTTIPVPEVYNAYTDDESGHVRIVMEFIEGDRLDEVWDRFDQAQKTIVITQLRDFFTQLRTFKGDFIGSIDGTACEDQLFSDEPEAYGPYANELQFNEGINSALRRADRGDWVELICDMIRRVLGGHEVVLTHGDFAPRNILVQHTKIVAILDWELAGYYPEYWEYVKALWRPPWETSWIKDKVVEQVLQEYLTELAVLWHTREIIW